MRRTARFATPSLGAGVATGGTVETVTGLCSVVGCALRSACWICYPYVTYVLTPEKEHFIYDFNFFRRCTIVLQDFLQ